ncbi:unnamed protein product [Leptosia nina]|uniref:Uncharacterized protein n=1 Tax=Leptosia nina TaxID=320188 RepID=A0AAV1J874_9NEOP
MKSLSSLVLYILLSTFNITASVDVFQFGDNQGAVIFSQSGKIGPREKHVEVPVVLPLCMDVSYVRVDVDNPRAPPKVDFDSDASTVIITYRRRQRSRSSYTVIAKGVPSISCVESYE